MFTIPPLPHKKDKLLSPNLSRTPSSRLLRVLPAVSILPLYAVHSQDPPHDAHGPLQSWAFVLHYPVIPDTASLIKQLHVTLHTDPVCINLPPLAQSTEMNVNNLEDSENQPKPTGKYSISRI